MLAATALLLLAGGFGFAEMTGITGVAAGLARLLRQPEPRQTPEVIPRPRPPIPARGPDAPTLPGADVSLDASRLDRGFQEEVQEIQNGIYAMQKPFTAVEGEEQSPDSLALLRARLDALEQGVREGDRVGEQELLSVVGSRLDELEQDGHRKPSSDLSPVDESLSVIETHLEMLEQEVRESWP